MSDINPRNNYKAKYLKIRAYLDQTNQTIQPTSIGTQEIKQSINHVSDLLEEVQAATLSTMMIQESISKDLVQYNDVADLSFDEFIPCDNAESLPTMIRSMSNLCLTLMDRFALVSEAYMDIVSQPRQSPEDFTDLLISVKRQQEKAGILKTKTQVPKIDPLNPSGVGVKGKKVKFELNTIENQTSVKSTLTSEPNLRRKKRRTSDSIKQPHSISRDTSSDRDSSRSRSKSRSKTPDVTRGKNPTSQRSFIPSSTIPTNALQSTS